MAKLASGVITGTAAALGTISGLRNAKRLVINISGLTSETVYLAQLLDTTTYTGTSGVRPINLATGAVEAADSLLSNGDFLFDNLTCEGVKFVKSSTSETAVVTYRVNT